MPGRKPTPDWPQKSPSVRAEAERRRAAELAEIRAQLRKAFEAARDDARSVASASVSTEVARAETTMAKTAASLAAEAGKQAASVALRASVVALRWTVRRGRETAPVVIEFVQELPPRVLATAATLLVAGSVAVVGIASLTRPVAPFARSASHTAAALFGVAGHAVQTSIESTKRTEVPARPRCGPPQSPGEAGQATGAACNGMACRVLSCSARLVCRRTTDWQHQ